MMQGTAKAHTNMALIKYWGKRDEEKVLPTNSSLSLTLDKLYTTTTVTFDEKLKRDELHINHRPSDENQRLRVAMFLDDVRSMTGTDQYAMVTSINEMPTAAGLASSASGFAALAAAAAEALELRLDEPSLSRLARRGSGSACRSILGGFAEWRKGSREDGSDSFAVPVAPQNHWDLLMLIAAVTTDKKKTSSRDGMRRTVNTSPFYQGWLNSVEDDLRKAKKAISARDFISLGQVVEANALKMHATTLGAVPPFFYWEEATIAVMKRVHELRESGVPAFFTIDAGANVGILCEPANEKTVHDAIARITGVHEVIVCRPGPGISYEGEQPQ